MGRGPSLYISLLIASLTLLCQCQKLPLCQARPERRPTFIGIEYALRQTDDPSYINKIDNYNFITMILNNTLDGAIYRVENNAKFENPVLTIQYTINPETKRLNIAYYKKVRDAQGVETTQLDSSEIYEYDFSYQLILKRVTTGALSYTYRFVEFTGAVLPGFQCTFNFDNI